MLERSHDAVRSATIDGNHGAVSDAHGPDRRGFRAPVEVPVDDGAIVRPSWL
jgi:hypothetical protein